jgi:CRP/FNR family transcriptional regulator, dissimilatory nitrate respiration regulator
VSGDGKEQILHIFGSGDHFAEVPAFDGDCFPASAAALEKSELLFFPRQSFLQLLEIQPKLAINMLKSFARHLRLFSHLVDNLALREVPGRLANYLLGLCEQFDNADTLSRVFSKLSREGVIVVDGSKVTLRDRKRLHDLAAGNL